MASKLRNKNQRNTTITRARGFDEQDPLDFETLNSQPKGNTKSKQMRLQDRQDREKLLQQHRLHQQEILKRQRERRNLQRLHLTAQQYEQHQHAQNELANESFSKTKILPDVIQENQEPGHKTEPRDDPVLKSDVHDHSTSGHDGHGALGDSMPRDETPNRQRCTNCCGRPQVQASRKEVDESAPEHIDGRFDGTGRLDPSRSRVSSFEENSNFEEENEMRLRGGCGGGCGGSEGTRNFPSCPCGGCGGAACATNISCDNTPPLGCCGGNQSRGLPCRCKCRSCSSPRPPCGTCGGRNCGKWNSCAGSGVGKCYFPRNTKRRNGTNCCGGGNGGCGGCC